MNYILGGRACGKTTKMVAWFLDSPSSRVLIVADAQRRAAVLQEIRQRYARPIKENDPRILVADSIQSMPRMLMGLSRNVELGIDELGACLWVLFGRPVSEVADTPGSVVRLTKV